MHLGLNLVAVWIFFHFGYSYYVKVLIQNCKYTSEFLINVFVLFHGVVTVTQRSQILVENDEMYQFSENLSANNLSTLHIIKHDTQFVTC